MNENAEIPIIQFNNVSKSYKKGHNDIVVFGGVNLSIKAGELVAVTGQSGSGKSTFLQLAGCLDRPTDGGILIGGKAIAKMHDAELSKLRRDYIGFIFQSFNLQPFLTLRDNVLVPVMFGNGNARRANDRAMHILKLLGLSDRLNHYPKELSGGEKQRAAIARALINDPKIILADEPTGNLDEENSRLIIDLLKQIRDSYGTTIIIVTHDPAIAHRADRTLSIMDGALV